MTRHPIGRFVVAAVVLAAILLPAVVHAQAIVKVNDDVWFRLGIQLQGWADWTQSATTRGYAENLYLRRDRLLVTGSVAPGVTFFFQTDDPNLGKAPKALGTGFIVQDAWAQWKINDAFMLNAGLFLVPLSRQALQSTASYLTLDISPTASVFSGPTTSSALRDTGLGAQGYLFDGGHLEYRAAVYQGVRAADSRNAFRDAAYLQYDVFDTERGYVYAGTNLGKKKILALSAGYDGQNRYHAYSGGAFTTIPMAGGNEFAANLLWNHYDGSTFLATIPRQNDYLVEAAIYAAAIKAQPFAKYEKQKFSAAAQQKNNITRWGGGLHYYVHGQNLKLTGQFLRIMPQKPIKTTNEFTLAMQVWYY